MKSVLKNLIIIILVFGFGTAIVDYLRMSNGMMPIFNIKTYNNETRIENFRGLFYLAERKVKNSRQEGLTESTNMKFQLIVFDLKVPKKYREELVNFKVETKEISDCDGVSQLYYADSNFKVYTYCLDSIKVKENGKTNDLEKLLKSKKEKIIDDIEYALAYTGLYGSTNTMMYQSRDLRENDFTNNGLRLFHCNTNEGNTDIYIGPITMEYQNDFCTFKNDVELNSNDVTAPTNDTNSNIVQ